MYKLSKKPVNWGISKRNVPTQISHNKAIQIKQLSRGDIRPSVDVKIYGKKVKGLLDSGSMVTILGKNSEDLIRDSGLKLSPYGKKVVDANGKSIDVLGLSLIPYDINGKTHIVPTIIAPSLGRELILGMDAINKFGIKISFVESLRFVDDDEVNSWELTAEEKAQLDDITKMFRIASEEEISTTPVAEHYIDTGDSKPFNVRPHHWSPYKEAAIDKEIDRMLKLEIIERSNSPYSNPIVPVEKKDGSMRLCLDARKLNEQTKPSSYPLPLIKRILSRITKSKYITTIDLKEAFFQVSLEKNSREKTAFKIPKRGLFHFTKMPFGLRNSAQTMAMVIDKVLGSDLEPWVFYYLDDIIITTDSLERHFEILREVAKRLREANLAINGKKSKFVVKSAKFLGYILSECGLTVDPAKVDAIVHYPNPKSVKDCRRFMGAAGWYRRFIPDFSEITTPITDLIKKTNARFKWSKEAEEAFQKIKSLLMKDPILTNPDFEKPFKVQCDASDLGIAGILTQNLDDGEHVIAYFSRKLNPRERKYTTTEKECLAVLESVEEFRGYVEGIEFQVVTDHSALLWLKTMKDPPGKLARWILRLQAFAFNIVYRPGKLNDLPDALSRAVEIIELSPNDIADPEYLNLIQKIQNDPARFSDFKIVNGVVYKFLESRDDSDLHFTWKLFVPKDQVEKILSEFHNNRAHLGYFKTLATIREKYYWPFMSKDVKKFVENCDRCKASKSVTQITRPPIQSQRAAPYPWHTVSLDLMERLPRSREGFTHLLVITDWFSKMVLTRPLRTTGAKAICEFVEDRVFLLWGVPKFLISDNAKSFKSNEMKQLLEKYKVTHKLNAAHHPQHNPTERVNKVIGASLRTLLGDNQRDWVKFVPRITAAINSAVHESTKFSPYFINFGHFMKWSGQDHNHCEATSSQAPEDPAEHANALFHIRQLVQDNIQEAFKAYSHHYNLRTRPVAYNVGQKVWKKRFKQSNAARGYNAKYDDMYEPVIITEKRGSVYVVKNMKGKSLGTVHAKDLKP